MRGLVRLPAFRRSGPKREMRAVQDAVLAGQHCRGHLVIGGKLREDACIIAAFAQHGVRVGKRGEPALQLAVKNARVLARGKRGG